MNKSEIKNAIAAEKKRHADAMKYLESKLKAIVNYENEARLKAYKQRKAMLENGGNWLQDKIKVGDIVQVTGSKAGQFREVIAVDKGFIVGVVIFQRKIRTTDGVKIDWGKNISKVTEHGMNKITHLYRDGNFVRVKDLMERTVDISL